MDSKNKTNRNSLRISVGILIIFLALCLFLIKYQSMRDDGSSASNTQFTKSFVSNAAKSRVPNELEHSEVRSPPKEAEMSIGSSASVVEIDQDETESATDNRVQFVRSRVIPSVLSSSFETLFNLARSGDIDAAATLGKALQYCSYNPRTLAEFEELISSQPDYPMELARSNFETCEGITDKQLALSTNYLEMAVLKGDVESVLEFFKAVPFELSSFDENMVLTDRKEQEYFDDLNSRKLNYMKDAVSNGNVDAARLLANSYLETEHGSITPQDYKKALEYTLISMKLDPKNLYGTHNLYEFISLKLPVYKVDEAKMFADAYFISELQGNPTIKIQF